MTLIRTTSRLGIISTYFASIFFGTSYILKVNSKTQDIPEDQKGSLLIRMTNIACAHYQSKQMKHDKYTANNHVETISRLSLIKEKEMSASEVVNNTLVDDYFHTILENNPKTKDLVFYWEKEIYNQYGLMFFGSVNNLHGLKSSSVYANGQKSRSSILKGDYVRCESAAHVPKNKSKTAYRKTDVLVTGTTDSTICNDLKVLFLKNAAIAAARDKLNNKHPLSDTPVLTLKDNVLNEIGDLNNLPKSIKQVMRYSSPTIYKICTVYDRRKTELSNGDYKDVAGIILIRSSGCYHQTVCENLFIDVIKEMERVAEAEKNALKNYLNN